jgi:hypothetical protein
VVDEPEPLAPAEQVRVPRGAVGVHHEAVEPDDRRGDVDGDRGELLRREVVSAIQEGEAEVDPLTRAEEVAQLLVAVVAGDPVVDADERARGDVEVERLGERGDDDLGHQRRGPLRGAAELGEARAIIGLDDDRPGAAAMVGGEDAASLEDPHAGVSGAMRRERWAGARPLARSGARPASYYR